MKKTVLLLVTCCLTLALGATQAFADSTANPCKKSRWSSFADESIKPLDCNSSPVKDKKAVSATK